MSTLVAPHNGKLLDLYVANPGDYKARANQCVNWNLTARQMCDIELILNGAMSPLDGFMSEADYDSVVSEMRLQSGVLWPLPITLDVDQKFAESVSVGQELALRDPEGVVIALLQISDIWQPDKALESQKVFATEDEAHPGVYYLKRTAGSHYIGGKLIGIEAPLHYSFNGLRRSPKEVRELLTERGWHRTLAFQTRNPIHRAHVVLTQRLMAEYDAKFMIHAAVGITKPGDIDVYCRVRCYQKILAHYPKGNAEISLVPLGMRMGGPREALWQAIVRQNFGFSHFLVGRDHAGPGRSNRGGEFYGVDDSKKFVAQYQDELNIEIVPLPFLLYSTTREEFTESDKLLEGEEGLYISGAELRNRLHRGEPIPKWFSFPEISAELHQQLPERSKVGFTLFFTGLSGSGKSTLANGVVVKLREMGGRKVTLLDGDVVRKSLSSELNFSKEHRDINVRRIGYVASEITKFGGIAVCAPIAPYAAVRSDVQRMVSENGVFVEIHVATPLEVCEQRDRKGLYALAREGKIKEFTGISDPYEEPEAPALRIDTSQHCMADAVQIVLDKLVEQGLIPEQP